MMNFYRKITRNLLKRFFLPAVRTVLELIKAPPHKAVPPMLGKWKRRAAWYGNWWGLNGKTQKYFLNRTLYFITHFLRCNISVDNSTWALSRKVFCRWSNRGWLIVPVFGIILNWLYIAPINLNECWCGYNSQGKNH